MIKEGKYLPLAQYFSKCTKQEIQMTFSEIENILHDELPSSARKYSAWWSNNDTPHVQASSWLDEGYQSHSLSLDNETICFTKVK